MFGAEAVWGGGGQRDLLQEKNGHLQHQELCLDVNAADDKAARQHWQEEVSLLLHLYFEEGGGLGPVVVL